MGVPLGSALIIHLQQATHPEAENSMEGGCGQARPGVLGGGVSGRDRAGREGRMVHSKFRQQMQEVGGGRDGAHHVLILTTGHLVHMASLVSLCALRVLFPDACPN